MSDFTTFNFKSNELKKKIYFSIICLIPIFLIFSKAIADFLCVSILIIFFFNFQNIYKNIKIHHKPEIILFLLFYSYLVLNSTFSEYQDVSLKRGLPYLRFFVFTVFLAYIFSIIDKKYINIFFRILIYLLVFVSLSNILEFLSIQIEQNNFFFEPEKNYKYRSTGIFRDAISGSYLSKFIPLSLIGMLILKYNLRKKIIINFFLLLGLFVAGERAAILFVILVYFLIFIFLENLRKFIIIISTFSLISFVALMYFFPHYKIRMIDSTLYTIGLSKFITNKNFDEAYHVSGGTVLNKIDSIKDSQHGSHILTAYNIWIDNKYFGTGLKTFRFVSSDKKYDKIDSSNSHLRASTHPHNYYFEVLSELGIFGILFFLTIPILILVKIFKSRKYKISKDKVYFLIPLLVALTHFWPLTTTGSFFTNWNSLIFWFIYGIGLGLNLRIIKKNF